MVTKSNSAHMTDTVKLLNSGKLNVNEYKSEMFHVYIHMEDAFQGIFNSNTKLIKQVIREYVKDVLDLQESEVSFFALGNLVEGCYGRISGKTHVVYHEFFVNVLNLEIPVGNVRPFELIFKEEVEAYFKTSMNPVLDLLLEDLLLSFKDI